MGGAAAGGETMAGTMAPDGDGAEYSWFDYDGAKFRRRDKGLTWSVDDVLQDGRWVPYQGADRLKPAFFGDAIADPLAQPGEGGGRMPGGEGQA